MTTLLSSRSSSSSPPSVSPVLLLLTDAPRASSEDGGTSAILRPAALIHARMRWIWNVTIRVALTFAPPTATALTAILSSSSASKAVMVAWPMVDGTARLPTVYRCAAHPRLPLLHSMHALEAVARRTRPFAMVVVPWSLLLLETATLANDPCQFAFDYECDDPQWPQLLPRQQ